MDFYHAVASAISQCFGNFGCRAHDLGLGSYSTLQNTCAVGNSNWMLCGHNCFSVYRSWELYAGSGFAGILLRLCAFGVCEI